MEETTSFPYFIWHYTCVPGENGIRGSKDPQAGLRKYLRPTNERKQMSIKTLRKRIAVVAVSALTAGVISVVAAPVANAAEAAGDIDFSTPSDILNVGICTYTNSNTANATIAYARSGSSIRLVRTTLGAAGDNTYLKITGPAIFTSHSVADGTTAAATMTPTTITDGTAVAGDLTTLLLTGVGTVSISYGADATSNPVDTITIYSVASCANSAWSATYSLVQMSTTAAGNATSNVDVVTAAQAGTPMYIKLQPKDAYQVAITTGTLMASATNGALVSWGAAAAGFPAGAGSVATSTPTANHQLRVDPAQTSTTSTTTVTITLDGTAVATKTITFHGEQAKIVIGTVYAGKTSDADDGAFTYTFQDSAGNTVPGDAAVGVAASYGTRVKSVASVKAPTISSATIGNANDVIEAKITGTTNGKTTAGVMTYECGSSAGTADVTIAATSTVNANTLTATVTGKCYGSVSTYTVATDKAKYNIGDIAIITIEAKDSSGNPVTDTAQLQAGSVSVGGGDLTYTILGTTAADSSTGAIEGFQNGIVKLRAQMKTAGTFNAVVALAGTKVDSATASYTVIDPATVGAVSNAEVLKSIVALIASINKQIAALQKLILAKK